MARINIEECWWTDPRRSLLIARIGSELNADAVAIRAWRLAQQFWKCGRGLVPKDLFETLPFWENLIDSKLAVVEDSFVYVRGSSAYLDWVHEKQQQAKEAGKKSAAARKAKNGTAQPKPKKAANQPENPERTPNEPRTESNDAEPSYSYSYSYSSSSSDSASGFGSGSLRKDLSTNPPQKNANAFLAAYCERFKAKHGTNPHLDGKDAGIAKRVSKAMTQEKIELYLDAYFAMPDSGIFKAKHPLNLFELKKNEVVVFAQTGNFTTHRQARDADDFANNAILLQKVRAEGA